jgi:MATE family multidrug resistance protein
MIIAIVVNVLNIGFNLLFVYQFNMTSDGVALGTVLAQYGGLLLAILLFRRSYKHYLKYWDLKKVIEIKALKEFFGVNKDIMIRTVLLLFAFAFFTSASASISNKVLAINTLLLQYLFIFSYFIDGYAHASEALVGKFIGARDKLNLKFSIKRIFLWGIGISVPFTLVYLLIGDKLLYILTDNLEVIDASAPYLKWIAVLPMVSFAAFIWDGVYTGATATALMRNSMIISTLVVFLPVYYIFRNIIGDQALWLALTLFMLSRSVLLSIYYPKAVLGKIK